MKNLKINIAAALALLLAVPAAQATVLLQGTFTGDFPGTVPTLSGSFSAEFDDSVVTGAGNELFSNLSILSAFTLNPNPLGATLFDTVNAGLTLRYFNGSLSTFVIGGLIAGVNGVSSTNDDFSLTISANSGNLLAGALSAGGVVTQSTIGSGTITQTQVPEPTTLALAAIGLIGIGGIRRRAKCKLA